MTVEIKHQYGPNSLNSRGMHLVFLGVPWEYSLQTKLPRCRTSPVLLER